jgi:hypothetical protein
MIDHERSKQNRPNVEVVERFPSLAGIAQEVWLGSFSWMARALKTQWVLSPYAYNWGWGITTPTGAARSYLTLKYPNRRVRMTRDQYAKCVNSVGQAPLYCVPTANFDGLYVDIKSAYWQIVSTVGWDVNYNPSKFLCVQSDNSDFPFKDHKMARNCLVSIGLSGMTTVMGFTNRSLKQLSVRII